MLLKNTFKHIHNYPLSIKVETKLSVGNGLWEHVKKNWPYSSGDNCCLCCVAPWLGVDLFESSSSVTLSAVKTDGHALCIPIN